MFKGLQVAKKSPDRTSVVSGIGNTSMSGAADAVCICIAIVLVSSKLACSLLLDYWNQESTMLNSSYNLGVELGRQDCLQQGFPSPYGRSYVQFIPNRS